MKYFDKRAEVLEYVGDRIDPVYFENIVAYTINNFGIESRADVPHLFGDNTPIQKAFEDYILFIISDKGSK